LRPGVLGFRLEYWEIICREAIGGSFCQRLAGLRVSASIRTDLGRNSF
jgi:hypothetical protein